VETTVTPSRVAERLGAFRNDLLASVVAFLVALPLCAGIALASGAPPEAFVASAETLLCAAAVDKLHRGPRTQYDRELAAQCVGNLLCGLLGALPMTGVVVRSAANVESGARTRAAAVLHGLWLLVFVCAFPFVLRWVPTAALAALLVYTGYNLVNPQAVRTLWKYGRGEVVIYAASVVTIVATDLLTGVLVGVGLSAAKLHEAAGGALVIDWETLETRFRNYGQRDRRGEYANAP
jgi:MFS superfamily sulfate permease-like transporter